jgi:hypothetical protein
MPNRRERLAARAIARKRPTDRVVAVHEAGHAVGRVLTAEQLGYSLEDAIDRIDVGVASGGRSVSLDGRAKLISQAVTFGPKFSRELSDFFKASKPGSEVEFTWSASALRSELSPATHCARGFSYPPLDAGKVLLTIH